MKREQEIRSVKIPLLTQRHAFGCAMFFTMRQAIGGIRSLRREIKPAIPSDEGLQIDEILVSKSAPPPPPPPTRGGGINFFPPGGQFGEVFHFPSPFRPQ